MIRNIYDANFGAIYKTKKACISVSLCLFSSERRDCQSR